MFTLKRGSVAGIGYGIVQRPDGSDVCTAVWTESTKRWRNIDFPNPSDMKCNRTRQAAARVLRSVEGQAWTPEPVAR